eukprot:3460942-Ditylum_brightwellii.AAC.1
MKTCELLFCGDGHSLPGFMIGHQLCVVSCFVVSCFFIIACVTSLKRNDNNIFGVSDAAQTFFNMGFLGAVIKTILGSISWQLVASAFPLAFLSNSPVYVLHEIPESGNSDWSKCNQPIRIARLWNFGYIGIHVNSRVLQI